MPSAMRIGSLQSATILILSAIALGCASRVWGTGWKLVTVSNEVSSIKYCLANDRGAKARSGYTFPEYNTSDTMLFEGYELLNRVKGWKATFGHVKKGDVAHFAWSKKFTSLYIDSTTAINQRLYTEGVDDYSIRLRLTNGHWFSKKFKLPHEYYQVPRTDEIVKWKSVTSNLSVGDLLRDVDSSTGIKMGIDSLIVVTTPKEKYKFVFGSFRLVDRVQVKRSVYHPLFDPILDYSGTRYFEKDNFYSPRGVPGLILPMAYYALHGHPNATFYFEEDSPNTHEILKLKIKTFRRIVDTYPFYQERKLDKHSTLERLDSFNSLVDNEAYSDSIAALFRDFGDPHLKIVDSSKKRQKRNVPIVPYELNGHTYVAVVLDSRLADEVPIGSEILEIDGQAVLAARSSGLSVRTLLTKEKGSQASLLLSHKSRWLCPDLS